MIVGIPYKKIILAVAIIAIMACLFFAGRRSNNAQIDSYENILRTEKQKTREWQDKSGYWHSKAETAELKGTEALEYLSKVDAKFSNLSKEFEGVKKDLRNVHYVGFTGTTSDYTVHTSSKDTLLVLNGDTAYAKYFNYVDSTGWFTASGVMLNNGNVPYLNFQSKDSLTTVITKKRRLFRKPLFTQEIKSYNPHTKITYNKSILVNKKKRFLGLF